MFAIQDEIANAILEQMKAALLDQAPISTKAVDTLAYDLYLLARQKIRDRNEKSLSDATALLDQAIEKDPTFAAAYAQRAIAEILLSVENYGTVPHNTARGKAKTLVDQALALDSSLAEAWAAHGLYWNQATLASERQNAIESLQRALELNPSLSDASNWLQNVYRSLGELSEARRLTEEILERDPLYRPAIQNAITLFSMAGQPEKARAVLK